MLNLKYLDNGAGSLFFFPLFCPFPPLYVYANCHNNFWSQISDDIDL